MQETKVNLELETTLFETRERLLLALAILEPERSGGSSELAEQLQEGEAAIFASHMLTEALSLIDKALETT